MLWDCPPGWQGNIQQMWFRGAHGDIGGMIGEDVAARPLANIPLVWMLERAETLGLALPEGWRAGLATDAAAPAYGTLRAWGLAFLLRARAFVGLGQRLALLVGGVVCVGVALGSAGFDATRSGLGLVAVFLGLLVLGYGLAHYSARTFSKVLSPTWGRWGDVFEWLAIIGVIPTLLGVLDLYSYFASRF